MPVPPRRRRWMVLSFSASPNRIAALGALRSGFAHARKPLEYMARRRVSESAKAVLDSEASPREISSSHEAARILPNGVVAVVLLDPKRYWHVCSWTGASNE